MKPFSSDLNQSVNWGSPVTIRDPSNLQAVLHDFHLRGFSRYVSRILLGMLVRATLCNFFTREVMAALGVKLPDGMLANEMFDWLLKPDAREAGWEPAGAEVAQACADKGMPVIAVSKNVDGHGHIAPLTVSLGQAGIWVSHVGQNMYLRCRLEYAFGSANVLFYVNK